MTITPVLDAGGAVTHFIAIKRDVSRRHQAEERVQLQARMLDVVKLIHPPGVPRSTVPV